MDSLRSFLKTHPSAMDAAAFLYTLVFSPNVFFHRRIHSRGAFIRRCRFDLSGPDVSICVGRMARVTGCRFSIQGANGSIQIGGGNTIVSHSTFCAHDDGSAIRIGRDFTMEGGEIAATEGEEIIVGDDCMFSYDIDIRNGDSHVVLDRETGRRTNRARTISIGRHVWLAGHAVVLKGSVIPDDCIIGNRSSVIGKLPSSHSIYAGIPARLVRGGVTWDRFRLHYQHDGDE